MIILGIFLKNSNEQQSKKTFNEPEGYSYSGIYNYNDTNLYVYQEDNEIVYFGQNKDIRCRAQIEKDYAKGLCNGENGSNEYTLTIADNKLQISSENLKIASGLYTKVSDITLEKYFEMIYGDILTFKSKYNGMYRLDDKEIILYNINADRVKLIASSSMSTLLITLDVIEDNTLSSSMIDGDITIKLDDNGNIIFSTKLTNDSIANQFNGKYDKIKSINYIDIIKNNIGYYYG